MLLNEINQVLFFSRSIPFNQVFYLKVNWESTSLSLTFEKSQLIEPRSHAYKRVCTRWIIFRREHKTNKKQHVQNYIYINISFVHCSHAIVYKRNKLNIIMTEFTKHAHIFIILCKKSIEKELWIHLASCIIIILSCCWVFNIRNTTVSNHNSPEVWYKSIFKFSHARGQDEK